MMGQKSNVLRAVANLFFLLYNRIIFIFKVKVKIRRFFYRASANMNQR